MSRMLEERENVNSTEMAKTWNWKNLEHNQEKEEHITCFDLDSRLALLFVLVKMIR